MATVTQAHRILYVRTDRLGETLLAIPAAVALKAALPGASLTLLVQPDLQLLLSGAPGIDQVMAYHPNAMRSWWARAWELGRMLRSQQFDVAVVSNPSKELHVAVWLARIPSRVGYNRKWGWLLTRRIPDRKALGEHHEVEYNFDLVRALGLPVSLPQWKLPCFEREQAEVLQQLEQRGMRSADPFIVVHPWTSNPRKQWPVNRYQQLIHLMAQRLSRWVVVAGGPDERTQMNGLLPLGPQVIDMVGHLSLRQFAALLQRAQRLISNDSGPVHLAAAVGTPVIVLFGTEDPGSHPRRWGPWGAGHMVIQKPLADLTIDEVFAAVSHSVSSPTQLHT